MSINMLQETKGKHFNNRNLDINTFGKTIKLIPKTKVLPQIIWLKENNSDNEKCAHFNIYLTSITRHSNLESKKKVI